MMRETIDILAEDVVLPAVSEGDYLALLNTGGYGSASSSNHCMRGKFSEYLLIDEHMNGSGMQLTSFKPLTNNSAFSSDFCLLSSVL